MKTARRIALALAAIATLASCDDDSGSPVAPPDGAAFSTAPFPAPANFTSSNPTTERIHGPVLSWEDVPGDYGYLVQWRKGEAGTWKSLVSTGANRTTYATDSISREVPNYYRVAVITSDFRVGAFSTILLRPFAYTNPATLTSDTTATLYGNAQHNGSVATSWFEWGTDSTLAGAARTPDRSTSPATHFIGRGMAETIPLVPEVMYYYRLAASNGGGTTYGEIRRLVAAAPAAPAGFSAVFSEAPLLQGSEYSSAHNVRLQWTHDAALVHTFRVQRRLVGAANWVQAAEIPFYAGRSHLDVGFPISSPREYDYRVLACNQASQCSSSPEVRVAMPGLPAPQGFTATRAPDGRVTLAWQTGPSWRGTAVQWRAGETGSWQHVVSAGSQVATITTDRVAAGVTNYYRVAGEVRNFRQGALSEERAVAAGAGRSLQVQTSTATTPSSTAAIMRGSVTPNGMPATAWIEWGTDPSLAGAAQTPARPVGAGLSAVAFSDTVAVASGQTYYYRAAASNTLGTVRGAIQTFYAGPPSPAVVTPVFDLPNYRMVVTWTHDGRGTPSIARIERRPAGQTAWTRMSENTHSDFPANVVRTYEYRVTLCNAANECSVSAVATGKTQPLAAPAGLATRRRADGLMILDWQDITGEVGYLVQWRTDPAGPWQHVVSTVANVKTYGTPKVTPGTTNYYRVAGEASGFRQGLFSEISVFVP